MRGYVVALYKLVKTAEIMNSSSQGVRNTNNISIIEHGLDLRVSRCLFRRFLPAV